jgi:hypothetical protein
MDCHKGDNGAILLSPEWTIMPLSAVSRPGQACALAAAIEGIALTLRLELVEIDVCDLCTH